MSQAYDEIKRRIITLDLEPGSRVDDYQLSDELEISRTPVREAIFMLASEGLVDIRPRAGFTVRGLDLLSINDIFEAHFVISKAVSMLAALRATPEDLRAMREAAGAVEKAIDERDHFGITSSNADFHRAEAVAAHSAHLGAMAAQTYDHEQRLAFLCYGGGGRQWGGLDELFSEVKRHHAALIGAYAAKDSDTAQALAIEHARLFMKRVQTCVISDTTLQFQLDSEDLSAVSFVANDL